jgi:hypothetical protein
MSCRHCRIHGVTFLSYDGAPTTDGHTLLSLARLYSTLNISSPQSLSPPHRLLFPVVPTFAGPRPQPDNERIRRQRSNIGVSPQTLKAAYPSLAGAEFAEDFVDFADIGIPVLFDRVIVADRGAARRGGSPRHALWAAPFTSLRASEDWFDATRRTLAQYFFGEDESTAEMPTVTYLSRQDGPEGERLRAADHTALLNALSSLTRSGIRVHIMDESASWSERMRALAQSTVSLEKVSRLISD